MPKIPNRNTTKGLLDNLRVTKEYPRPYLGMSGLGNECAALLWFDFHWCSKKIIRPRLQRIFDLGKKFEEIAIANLKEIGVSVYRWENGKKVELTGAYDEDQETLIGFAGHESGHTDGRAMGFVEFPDQELGCEFKSMNDAAFEKIKKVGLQEANPTYYGQTQRYMKAQEIKVTYFLAINKNNGAYYQEFVYFDKATANDLSRKAKDIILSDKPMPRAYPDGFWKCFNCSHKSICHGDKQPAANCRTCAFSNIEDNGGWSCENKQNIKQVTGSFKNESINLSLDAQKEGCKFYQKGWGL